MSATMLRRWQFSLLMVTLIGASGCAPDPASMPDPRVLHAASSPVIGLDRRSVQSHWGSPTLLRREGPGELWQYRSAECVLDVFFYPAPDTLRVAHLTVRPAGRPPAYCINRPTQSAGLAG